MLFVCTLLDVVLHVFGKKHVKRQGAKAVFSIPQWIFAASVSSLNMLVVVWPIWIPVLRMWQFLYGDAMMSENASWYWANELPKIVICGLVTETIFFWTHYAIHVFPYLYKNVHKFHHENTAPTAAAVLYAHPLEFMFNNVAGINYHCKLILII
jgi:sterol desaturase/sphingolipid hydroxylase (fatty acid hydroxylase superfamily)